MRRKILVLPSHEQLVFTQHIIETYHYNASLRQGFLTQRGLKFDHHKIYIYYFIVLYLDVTFLLGYFFFQKNKLHRAYKLKFALIDGDDLATWVGPSTKKIALDIIADSSSILRNFKG